MTSLFFEGALPRRNAQATSTTPSRHSPGQHLPNSNSQSPIANQQLPITNHQSPIRRNRWHSTSFSQTVSRLMRKIGSILCLLFFLVLAGPAMALPTIVVDAGHGGHDRGGGPGQRIPEKPYVLDIALRLRAALREAGFPVVMTRSSDVFVTLGGRCAAANSRRGAVFVSVHLNSAPREGADGIETYFYSKKSASLAAAIHPRLVRAAGTEDRRVRQRGYYVLRNTRGVAVLCECGFLTNRAEASRILTASHRERLARAIAAGIIAQYR
jgi:N-acetylmuramoyl-L-alanine amidase